MQKMVTETTKPKARDRFLVTKRIARGPESGRTIIIESPIPFSMGTKLGFDVFGYDAMVVACQELK